MDTPNLDRVLALTTGSSFAASVAQRLHGDADRLPRPGGVMGAHPGFGHAAEHMHAAADHLSAGRHSEAAQHIGQAVHHLGAANSATHRPAHRAVGTEVMGRLHQHRSDVGFFGGADRGLHEPGGLER